MGLREIIRGLIVLGMDRLSVKEAIEKEESAIKDIKALMVEVIGEELEVSNLYYQPNNNLTHSAKEANAIHLGFNEHRAESLKRLEKL